MVQSGKGTDTHYRAESESYYGTVKGKPVKLCANRDASLTMLGDRIREAERGEAGHTDPFAGSQKLPLAEHIEAFGTALATKGSSAYHVAQTVGKVRNCLLNGCGFKRLDDVNADAAAEWLKAQMAGGPAAPSSPASSNSPWPRRPRGPRRQRAGCGEAVRQQRLAATRQGSQDPAPREAVAGLAGRRAAGMSGRTASRYRAALGSFGPGSRARASGWPRTHSLASRRPRRRGSARPP